MTEFANEVCPKRISGILEFQARGDYQIKQGSYYTILVDSLSGHMQIIDSHGNYYNLGRSIVNEE